MTYMNAYVHRRPGREYYFTDNRLGLHSTREHADECAAWEEGVEPFTKRIGVWRIKRK